MTHTRFFTIALPLIAIPALIVLLLPENILVVYVDIVEPVSLLIGSFLALWVSFIYRKQLKAAFIYLSLFLLFYALSIILFLACNPILIPSLNSCLEEAEIYRIIQAVQFIIYAMLLLFCINLLRVINVTKLNRSGWVVLSLTIVFCLLLVIYPVLDQVKNIADLEMTEIFRISLRILDALLVIVLMPVLWLYIQYLKSHQRQSLTFTIIILGIACATVFDYFFQLITTLFPSFLSERSILYTSIPEALFIYGYLIIAAGLYAHRKQDEWGFNTIDKMLTGESEPAGKK